MNFQDKRLWYIVIAVVVVLIIVYAMWPAGEVVRARRHPVSAARARPQRQLSRRGGRCSRAAERRTRTLSMRRPSMSTTSNRQPP